MAKDMVLDEEDTKKKWVSFQKKGKKGQSKNEG